MFLYPTPYIPGLFEASIKPKDRAERVKPRLVRVFNHTAPGFEWRCSDHSECWAIGWGATREAAYEQWLARFAHCRRGRTQ